MRFFYYFFAPDLGSGKNARAVDFYLSPKRPKFPGSLRADADGTSLFFSFSKIVLENMFNSRAVYAKFVQSHEIRR